ncbi:phosphopentomutase/phosphoglucosamine mutase [Halorussus salilacus]|uniref:phosphopentomutase/phosphoglucosamine mutase n=1 Tax=Halorussus salilacus TaxID=2953750 RepID=UPI00209EE128|nr:phosphopentomutase/phosphoglucosamine mutase [Halorussus salilacus]USZ68779.1 phosphopentomutase/phosphoglucosamine mutase [Halorussus salilacus]
MDLFGTAGIRGSAVETVTPELALAVGRAAGRDGSEFVVARDGRETGPALAAAMEAGLESAGADVRRAGRLPTPALAFASRGRRGVMITASHNPPTDNGIKLFADGQEYDREAELTVEDRVEADDPPGAWDEWGDSERVGVLDAYRDAVVEYTVERSSTSNRTQSDDARQQGAPLDGLRVAVDCGNGVAALATPQVLRALGAEVVTLNANVDGHFPGRESKPTPETLADLREFVRTGDAELGIGHDGDADRIVVVDSDGEVVHEDTVVAVLAAHYTRESDAADPVVVTTPNASGRIDERVEAEGGRVERVRLGALHEGIATAREDGGPDTEVAFAAEPWKHVHTRFGGWIDGVTSAAVVCRLVAEAGGVGPLREPVTERPYRKRSVSCPDAAKGGAMERLETAIPERFPEASVETEYGVRAAFPDGSWVLVRPSGTEPYVRVYAESDDVDALVAEAVAVVEAAVEATAVGDSE